MQVLQLCLHMNLYRTIIFALGSKVISVNEIFRIFPSSFFIMLVVYGRNKDAYNSTSLIINASFHQCVFSIKKTRGSVASFYRALNTIAQTVSQRYFRTLQLTFLSFKVGFYIVYAIKMTRQCRQVCATSLASCSRGRVESLFYFQPSFLRVLLVKISERVFHCLTA